MKVGDYVRTKNGIICKIVSGNEDNYNIDIPFKTIEDSEDFGEHFLEYNDNGRYFTEDIYKSSPNIINLIEVGDYVNGLPVDKVDGTRFDKNDLRVWLAVATESLEKYGTTNNEGDYDFETLYRDIKPENIKSIVTKEQFKSMEYKVG